MMGEVAVHCSRGWSSAVHVEDAEQQAVDGMGMLNRKLSMAWEKWQFTAAEVARQQFMLRMLNSKLSMAWEQWQFVAAEVARQQFMLAGALNRLVKSQLSMAWEKWQV